MTAALIALFLFWWRARWFNPVGHHAITASGPWCQIRLINALNIWPYCTSWPAQILYWPWLDPNFGMRIYDFDKQVCERHLFSCLWPAKSFVSCHVSLLCVKNTRPTFYAHCKGGLIRYIRLRITPRVHQSGTLQCD